jgi:hypothetical protein
MNSFVKNAILDILIIESLSKIYEYSLQNSFDFAVYSEFFIVKY